MFNAFSDVHLVQQDPKLECPQDGSEIIPEEPQEGYIPSQICIGVGGATTFRGQAFYLGASSKRKQLEPEMHGGFPVEISRVVHLNDRPMSIWVNFGQVRWGYLAGPKTY